MAAELESFGVPMVGAESSDDMALDAARRGWISWNGLAEVHARSADGQA